MSKRFVPRERGENSPRQPPVKHIHVLEMQHIKIAPTHSVETRELRRFPDHLPAQAARWWPQGQVDGRTGRSARKVGRASQKRRRSSKRKTALPPMVGKRPSARTGEHGRRPQMAGAFVGQSNDQPDKAGQEWGYFV